MANAPISVSLSKEIEIKKNCLVFDKQQQTVHIYLIITFGLKLSLDKTSCHVKTPCCLLHNGMTE